MLKFVYCDHDALVGLREIIEALFEGLFVAGCLERERVGTRAGHRVNRDDRTEAAEKATCRRERLLDIRIERTDNRRSQAMRKLGEVLCGVNIDVNRRPIAGLAKMMKSVFD